MKTFVSNMHTLISDMHTPVLSTQVDPNTANERNGRTALHRACYK